MALKYNVEYKHNVKIGDRTLKYRPWNTKNEKDYLIAVEAEENITDEMLFELLVAPCLEDPNTLLTSNEQKYIMIEIRKKSLGSSFPMKYSCVSCKNVNDIDVEFDDIVKFKPDSWKSVTNGNMIFVFGPVPSENLKKKITEATSPIEQSFVEFLVHIKEIEIDGVLENTFTFAELKDFVESLPSDIFDALFKEYKQMASTLVFEHKELCSICGAENEIDFSYLPNFLWT